jgi:uncharacterized protein (UPF0333 family)
MVWKNWIQINVTFLLAFFAEVLAAVIFQHFGLDTNFLISFTFAMISIIISVTFFILSSEVQKEMLNKLRDIENKFTGGLSGVPQVISTILSEEQIREGYEKMNKHDERN